MNDIDQYDDPRYQQDDPDLCEVDKIESARPTSWTEGDER